MKGNGYTGTHPSMDQSLGIPKLKVSDYRSEVKRIGHMTETEYGQCLTLGETVFHPKKGLRDFVRRFYFSDNRRHILTYYEKDVTSVHSFYAFDIKGYKVLNFAFAVVDKNHRNNGICKKAVDLMLDYGRSDDCSIGTLRLFSPKSAEKFSKSGFQTPIIHDVDHRLIEAGRLIGNYFREDLDSNLIIDTSRSIVPTFDFRPVQLPAENQTLNNTLLEKDNIRIRMMCWL